MNNYQRMMISVFMIVISVIGIIAGIHFSYPEGGDLKIISGVVVGVEVGFAESRHSFTLSFEDGRVVVFKSGITGPVTFILWEEHRLYWNSQSGLLEEVNIDSTEEEAGEG